MTRAECLRIATAARVKQAIERGHRLDALLASGGPLKQAAYRIGWSIRSAGRWRQARKQADGPVIGQSTRN